jgi:hypothetical protein
MSLELALSQHWHIANHVPSVQQLTDASPRNEIGSFVMPTVRHGDYIPLDPQYGLEANFHDIDALSADRDLRLEFDIFKENNPTRELLNGLGEHEQHLVSASLFAVTVATEFFGDIFSGDRSEDNRKLGWTPVDPERSDTLYTKQLSETADNGACLEYSIFTQEVLSRLGEDVALATGFQQPWSNQDGFPHAFLSAAEGRIVIDPLFMAALKRDDSSIPRGVYKSTSEETFLSNPTAAVEYMDLAGDTSRYSASPIAAAEVSAAPGATSTAQG